MDLIEDIDLILNEFDEEVDIRQRRPYNSGNRFHQWDNLNRWDDLEFFHRFRLTNNSVLEILPLIEVELSYESNRNNPIPPLQQFLLTLRFYSTGAFYIAIGDFGKIHKTTACKIIHKVTNQLARLRQRFISMPSLEL